MPFSLNVSTIQPTPLLEKIRVAAAAGYQGIELWAAELYQHVGRGGEISDVEKALSDYGLTVPCIIAVRNWGETSGREQVLALDEARRRFELAARVGSPLIVCTPPLVPVDPGALVSGYRELIQIGRETGVQAVLEYISFFAGLSSLPGAVDILDACGDPSGCLVIDAFHNWNSATSVEDLRALAPERIAHYHIDDAAPGIASGSQVDTDRVMPGDGVIDLVTELQILREKNYKGWISLELFNAEWWAKDPLETAKVGLERMTQLCEQAGLVL